LGVVSIGEKMNWKEFLKPDWKKIIISIVIFAVLFIFFIFPQLFVPILPVPLDMRHRCCNELSQNQNLSENCNIFANQTSFIFTQDNCSKYIADMELVGQNAQILLYASIVVIIIFSYLFSCFLFWIFTRKKEKPE
jgi:hypothetical protein